MPDENGNLTDQERLDLYRECASKEKFDPLALGSFLGALFAKTPVGVVAGIAKFFAKGYNEKGCTAFLTDAQRSKLIENSRKANGTWGLPTGRHEPH